MYLNNRDNERRFSIYVASLIKLIRL